ncbi:hypothetical protein ACFLRF_04905 [Candidatus Altiarchaeota archaeon]
MTDVGSRKASADLANVLCAIKGKRRADNVYDADQIDTEAGLRRALAQGIRDILDIIRPEWKG